MWATRTSPVLPPEAGPLAGLMTKDEFMAFDTSSAMPAPPQPEMLPTVASLMARWEAYASPEDIAQASRAWSFSIYCADEACAQANVMMQAGNGLYSVARATMLPAGVPGTPVMPSTKAAVRDGSALMTDGAGVPQGFMLLRTGWHMTSTSVAGITPPTGGPEGGGAAVPAPPRTIVGASAVIVTDPASAAGVGLLAVLSGVLSYAWPTLKGGVVGLFSRVREDDLVKHPARAAIMQRIEAEPGIHYQALLRAVGGGRGTMEHHVRKLVDGGLVTQAHRGGYMCYFPRGAGRHALASAGMAKSDGARAILQAVTNQPGLSSLEVAERCGLQPSTVTYHVKRLIEGGLVTAVRDGRVVRLHPNGMAGLMVMGTAASAS
jgi:predicted transcriptional regulator